MGEGRRKVNLGVWFVRFKTIETDLRFYLSAARNVEVLG